MREAQVMEAMSHLRENASRREIAEEAEVSQASTANTLRRLVAMKKLTATGGRGRYRRYHLPGA